MLEYVFGRSSLSKVYATIDSDNLNSRRVATKLGMHLKEVLEDGVTVCYYVMNRDVF